MARNFLDEFISNYYRSIIAPITLIWDLFILKRIDRLSVNWLKSDFLLILVTFDSN